MAHPLVEQLRFTRSEFWRGLVGLTAADACRRLKPMNCITWNIGHLAWQEQRYFLTILQDRVVLPELNEQFAYGCPASTPSLDWAADAWHTVVGAAEPFLDTLATPDLQVVLPFDFDAPITPGSLMQRVTYHYWYHLGENMAIRQALGHTGLPDFVGNIDGEAPFRPY